MNVLKLITGVALALTVSLSGCKPKDADIKAAVEEKLKANPQTANTMVSVDAGVAALSGELASEGAKAEAAKITTDVKGVKSVMNSITVIMPVTESPAVTAPVINPDETLSGTVRDAVKDFPGVTATVADGVVTLQGQVSKEDQRKIMMSVNSLRPKKVENKLTIK